MWRGLVCLVALVSCVKSAAVDCGDYSCPAGHACLPDGGCASPAQRAACAMMDEGAECAAESVTNGVCITGVCKPSRCGDGVRAIEETCDGDRFGTVSTCDQFGYYSSTTNIACSDTCEPELSPCEPFGTCGDALINGPEVCEPSLPLTKSCLDFGFGTGTLACAPTCGPDLDGCIRFGWTSVEMPEVVRSIHGTASTNVWVVGTNKLVRRYDGSEWKDVTTCVTGDVTAVYVLSDTDAFLVDATPAPDNTVNLVRVTASGCTTFDIGSEQYINGIWASSIDRAYITTETGIWTFTGSTVTHDVMNEQYGAIWGSGPDDVYALAPLPNYVRHFNGANWNTTETVPDISLPVGIWGTGPGDYYVAGFDAPATPGYPIVKHYTTSGGWTTVLRDLPILGTTGPSAYAAGGATHGTRTWVYSLSTSLRLFMLLSDGTGWANLDAPITPNGATPYVAPDGAVFLAAHQKRTVSMFEGTTRVATSTLHNPNRVHAAGGNLAVTRADDRTLWVWNGVSWTPELTGIDDVTVTPDGEVFVIDGNAADYGIRKRNPNGSYSDVVDINGSMITGTSATSLLAYIGGTDVVHWTGTQSPRDLPYVSPSALHMVTPSLAFAGFLKDGTTPAIARWDGGTAWLEIASPLAAVRGFSGASTNDVFAWGEVPPAPYTSALAHYDGVSWSLFSPQPPETYIRAVWGTSTDLFVGGDTGLHHYDGSVWSRVATGDPSEVRSLSGRGDSLYIATGIAVYQLVRTRPW